MRQLIALRKRHLVLGRGDIEFLEPDNHHVLAFVRHRRSTAGNELAAVVANLSRLAQHVELDLRPFAGAVPVEVFGQNRVRARSATGRTPSRWRRTGSSGSPSTPATSATDARSEPAGPARVAVLWPDLLPDGGRSSDRLLARWLPDRRWFAGKGATVRDVIVDDVDRRSTTTSSLRHRAHVVHRG